jgi:hypothetical protein
MSGNLAVRGAASGELTDRERGDSALRRVETPFPTRGSSRTGALLRDGGSLRMDDGGIMWKCAGRIGHCCGAHSDLTSLGVGAPCVV